MYYDINEDVNSTSLNPTYCRCYNFISNVHWFVLLVSDYRALGHDFTEMVYMNIFKLIHVPRLTPTSPVHIQILSSFTGWEQSITKTKHCPFVHGLLYLLTQRGKKDSYVLTMSSWNSVISQRSLV
jgi:hypothetical protein